METLDRDRVKYVYDVTMMMNTSKGAQGRITDALMGRRMVADLYIRRFHTSDIPKVKLHTTLQSIINAKLSQHRFWHCHENGLNETSQPILM